MKEKTIGCIHYGTCSGCVYNSLESPPEIYIQAKNFFHDRCHLDLELVEGAHQYYRTRAKLAVRAPDAIGLFKRGSHDIVAIPNCQVHHPRINQSIELLLSHFRKSNLSAYDEKSHKGDLRYIQCVVERQSDLVQLTLVLNCKKATQEWLEFAQELFSTGRWHSIWFNYNTKPTNTIFGPTWEKACGEDTLWERICGYDIAFGPTHFGQANLALFEQMLYDIKNELPQNALIGELYAGMGVIGLVLSEKAGEIRLCEVVEDAKKYFLQSVERLTPSQQSKLSYIVSKAQETLTILEGCQVAIVDPPRKGLGEALANKILKIPSLNELIYIACDYTALERDLRYILEHFPHWKVAFAKSYLFFPGTNQIETVVILKNDQRSPCQAA